MKKNKKVMAAIAMTMVFGLTAGTAYAQKIDVKPLPEAAESIEETKEEKKIFTKFKGEVTLLMDRNDSKVIRLKSEEGTEMDFRILKDTVFADSKGISDISKIEKGNTVTMYYVQPMVMTMQYPPMVDTSVVVSKDSESVSTIAVVMVDENNLATDNSVKLNISDKTPIFTADGAEFKGEVNDKVLIVYYTKATFSLPPQTSPDKIIVLEGMKTQSAEAEKPQGGLDLSDLENASIYAGDTLIKGATAYEKNGIAMVPLRSIADSFGISVEWDGTLKKIRLGTATTLSIGVNEYTIGRAMPISLESAPEIKDNLTYVPSTFFSELLNFEVSTEEGMIKFVDKN